MLDASEFNFTLMYHYRILPGHGESAAPDPERHVRYVKYWNDDRNIDRYITDRSAAKFHLIICLEHFPHVLGTWLTKNLVSGETVVQEMRRTLAFLQQQGMIHFDTHFGNILMSDGSPYLTAFGLVLDKSVALTKAEKVFLHRHTNYDDAEFIFCLGVRLYDLYRSLPERQRSRIANRLAIPDDPTFASTMNSLLDGIAETEIVEQLRLPDYYVAIVSQHRDVIRTMLDFLGTLRNNPRKDTPFPDRRLRRLLELIEASQSA